MNVEEVFHMNGGDGANSYAKNSHFQKKASEMVKHITIQTIQQAYLSIRPNSFGIADLGCSSGPNTLSIVTDLVEALTREITPPPAEIRVCLNDLPTNDFNSIFRSLPDLYRQLRKAGTDGVAGGSSTVFVSAHPGSFYGRVFPTSSLQFVYSSYSLHWLSRIPPGLYDEQGKSINKGKVYIAESSPPSVSNAYIDQFKEDFALFLRSRAEELDAHGRMVLILTGRIGHDHLERFETFGMEVKFDEAKESFGREVARTVRSVQESMLGHHFGEGLSLDSLFDIFARLVDEEMAIQEIQPANFILVLRKL
ncbi:unnamed protein product [Linum tenue]|uniref:Uncharacterized protein n=1 Tax=Linum tenue TaxID=586396 RepID=A0AAV0P2T0_9ROSI|nr:unnamed protein product [Linum tenue]